MGGLCRLDVGNLNQKSLVIVGSIANILAQRTGGCGEAGGGRGTGVEPSPSGRAWWKATQRTAPVTALPRPGPMGSPGQYPLGFSGLLHRNDAQVALRRPRRCSRRRSAILGREKWNASCRHWKNRLPTRCVERDGFRLVLAETICGSSR
jgi:hypothetical protein